ncbi:MAG: energy transducer TonB, partial [Woeseiaceae bacterium]
VMLPGILLADNDTRVTRITHVEDASSDRTPLVTAVPQYPKLARRDRIEGEATVCYTIDARGRIRRPTVQRSSHKMFAKPSLRAIKQSSYEPLPSKKDASVARACRTFRFRLNPVAIEEIE